jgi:hypothetical protein
MLDQDCEASFKPLLVATGIRERRQPVYDSFHAVDGGSLTPVGPSRPGTRLDFWTNSVVRTDFIPIPNLSYETAGDSRHPYTRCPNLPTDAWSPRE